MTVVGDPAGMRAAAAQLRYRAERFAVLASDVDARVGAVLFTGPAANRWRDAVAEQSARLRAGSSRLADTADALIREATWVEQERQRELLAGEL